MDIEKTYELMNELQIFKNLLKSLEDLKPERNSLCRYFLTIQSIVMDQVDYKKRDLIAENVKNCLKPSLEQKIKELEEEIKNGK